MYLSVHSTNAWAYFIRWQLLRGRGGGTSAAPWKPLPPRQPSSDSDAPVSQGKGQKARFRKASISTSAPVLQVFRMLPSGLSKDRRVSPWSTWALGSLHTQEEKAVKSSKCVRGGGIYDSI